MNDHLLRFQFVGTAVRGEWLELGPAWREVVSRHADEDVATELLGELTAAAMLLSATIKHTGRLTAQIMGDGPISLMVVECRASGTFRATVKRSSDIAMPDSESPDATELLNPNGSARFAITIDPRNDGQTAYQGIVPVEGSSVATILERYMDRSEQLPTRLWLAANSHRTVGLLLQKIPLAASEIDHDIDAWDRMQKLADTLSRSEMLATEGDTLLHRLFWQEQCSAIESRPLRFECGCSRERVATMLRMLGAYELDGLIAERGEVAVNCDYCNTPYRFDAIDVRSLFEPVVSPTTPTRH